MASKKQSVPITGFERLWKDFLAVYEREEDGPILDLEADITNSCRSIADYLRQHEATHYDRGDSTIYKNLLAYVQAKGAGQDRFAMNLPLLNAMTAVVHGSNSRYPDHYPLSSALKPSPPRPEQNSLPLALLADMMGIEPGKEAQFAKQVDQHQLHRPPGLRKWLGQSDQRKLLIWLLIGFLILLGSSFPDFFQLSISYNRLLIGFEVIWVLGVSFFIFQQSRSMVHIQTKRQISAAAAVNRLWNYWLLLWMSWFFFYLFLFVEPFIWPGQNQQWFPAFLHFLNNGSALCLGLMYLEMAERTTQQQGFRATWYPFLLIWVLLGAVELWAMYQSPDWELGFSILSGILGGSAMALFVSRFTSKILDVPQGLLFALMLYAVIQPSLPLITDANQTFTNLAKGPAGIFYAQILPTMLLLYAFLGKMMLLILLHWVRNSFRLHHFMLRVARLQQVESQLLDWGTSILKNPPE